MTKPYGLLADLHLHAWSAFATTLPSGVNSRLEMLLGEIERAAIEVKAAGGDTLVFAGDVFHVRGSVAPSVYNPTRDRLRHISQEHGVRIIIMPGNHDLEGRDSTRIGSAVTALEMPSDMDGDGGVGVISSPKAQWLDDQWIIMVPWFESMDDLKFQLENIEKIVWPTATVKLPARSEVDVIIHAPIDGVIEGLPCHGLDPTYLSGLGFKRVFAGHYHNHRCMTHGAVSAGMVPNGEVWSIGALAHHTWSDIGSRAGFLIVYPNEVNWRKSHLPEFLDLGKVAEFCEPEELPLLVEGNYVRVRVEAAKSKEVEAARQELLDMGARAVLVQAEPKAPVREGTTVATVKSGASLEVQVADFIKGAAKPELAEAVSKEAMDVLAAAGAMEV
jgi:DNA repair exonuclease SbcCD nuclease subunit